MKLANDPSQATYWLNPKEFLHCQYGFLTNLEWLRKEVSRLSRNDRYAEVRMNEKGYVALFTEKKRAFEGEGQKTI